MFSLELTEDEAEMLTVLLRSRAKRVGDMGNGGCIIKDCGERDLLDKLMSARKVAT